MLGAMHQKESASPHARHAYGDGQIWRTILATSALHGDRIQYYSNPDVEHPTLEDVWLGTEQNENNVDEALNTYDNQIRNFFSPGNRTAPAAPTNFEITNAWQVGENPELEWDASTTLGVNTYYVYRCENYVGDCGATQAVIAVTSETNYTDTEIEITQKDQSDDRYRYWVTAVQFGVESDESNAEQIWGAIQQKIESKDKITLTPPSDFRLHQNYPNPFNPNTEIRYDVPEDSHIRLSVYDSAGREVANLFDGFIKAGRHKVDFDARSLASGVYVYKLTAGKLQLSATMILAK